MQNKKKDLIRIEHLSKYYTVKNGLFSKKTLKAVDDVSFTIGEGETLGLVGESGCGKSTIGKTIINLEDQTSGKVFYNDIELTKNNIADYALDLQMIFQDPLSSLNPRMTVEDIIAEPMVIHNEKDKRTKQEIKNRVYEIMDLVGLRRDYAVRYPHEFSGGQCQRIGIARSLAIDPKFIVCDEPVSALDVSIKAQIINMFGEIQEKSGVSYLFITHDLLTARYISHRIAVMYLGKLVEIGPTDVIYDNPKHPYTKALLSAVSLPDVDSIGKDKKIMLEGEIPSPVDAPSGCPFRTRCPHATNKCAEAMPKLKEDSDERSVACWMINPQD